MYCVDFEYKMYAVKQRGKQNTKKRIKLNELVTIVRLGTYI